MQIGTDDNENRFVYVGWCNDCQDDYGYRFLVENVEDRKGRI